MNAFHRHLRIATAVLLCAISIGFVVWSVVTNDLGDLFERPLFIPGQPRMVAHVVAGDRAVHVLDDEIVLGVLINGRPRAYPLGFLSFGEHVNDRIGRHPVLVTW